MNLGIGGGISQVKSITFLIIYTDNSMFYLYKSLKKNIGYQYNQKQKQIDFADFW